MDNAERKVIAVCTSWEDEENLNLILNQLIEIAERYHFLPLCVTFDRNSIKSRGEESIRELYALERGFYDPLFGSIELPRIEGAPQAFVLSSGGTGIPVYRALQRTGVPFAAGILYENDVDYRLSRLLAVETVSEKPFQAISDAALERALALMHAVPRVIDAGMEIGATNRRAQILIDTAKAVNKYEGA